MFFASQIIRFLIMPSEKKNLIFLIAHDDCLTTFIKITTLLCWSSVDLLCRR